jgi:hypothetical protein
MGRFQTFLKGEKMISSYRFLTIASGCFLSAILYAVFLMFDCCLVLGGEFIVRQSFFFFLLSFFIEIMLYGVSYFFLKLSRPILYYGMFSVFFGSVVCLAIVLSMGREGMDAVIFALYLFANCQILCFFVGLSRFFVNGVSKRRLKQ